MKLKKALAVRKGSYCLSSRSLLERLYARRRNDAATQIALWQVAIMGSLLWAGNEEPPRSLDDLNSFGLGLVVPECVRE